MGRRKAGNGYSELIEVMVADYRAGLSRKAISARYGVSVPTVKDWLLRAGETLRDGYDQQRSQEMPLRLDIDEAELQRLYLDELWAPNRIAKHFNVTYDAIKVRIERLGLARTIDQQREASREKGRRIAAGSRAKEIVVRQKYAETCNQKYGVGNTFQLIPPSVPEWAREILSKPESLREYIETLPIKKRTIRQISELMECSYDWVARNTRSELFEGVLRREVSAEERAVRNFIHSLGVETIKRDRTVLGKQELDIYCPGQKVGIEYNGIYWHSAQFKNRSYHLDKTLGCEQAGVRLIHIWEHLWTDPKKKPIYENMIKHALGLTDHRLGARQTRVEKRPAATMRQFFEENNIQGYRNASSAYVLVDKKSGLDLMCYTTGHAYFGNGAYDMEIARGACRLGWSVSGGATKLWKAIIEDNPEVNSIVYYVDLNHYNGSSVSVLPGTKLIKKGEPSLWNWWPKLGVMKNREPSRHKEIMEAYKTGEAVPVWNAGTATYVWERGIGSTT
jgi:transposase